MGRIEPGQLGQLYDSHAAVLQLYARSWLDDQAAEDAVQQAFLSLMANGKAPRNPRTWLLRTVRNHCISQLRKRKTRREHAEPVARAKGQWFTQDPAAMIDAKTAAAGLDHLPPEHREVILLRLWGQLTLEQIAGITATSVSTAWQRYRDGLGLLRKQLESPCNKNHTT